MSSATNSARIYPIAAKSRKKNLENSEFRIK